MNVFVNMIKKSRELHTNVFVNMIKKAMADRDVIFRRRKNDEQIRCLREVHTNGTKAGEESRFN